MNSNANARLHWRRFIVDLLIGAASVTVAFAVTSSTEVVLYMLIMVGAMLGIGLIVEPNVTTTTARPTSDIGPQRFLSSGEPKPALPGL